jgi:hypothetical protein
MMVLQQQRYFSTVNIIEAYAVSYKANTMNWFEEAVVGG